MLNRLRLYIQDHPLQGWLLEIGILTALYLVLGVIFYAFSHEPFKPGMIFFVASFVLTPPTRHLERRFSEQGRREKPVSPRQEAAVGRVGAVLALCSVCALGLVMFGRHFGVAVTRDAGLGLLMVFSFSALLSLWLGYTVRHTPWVRRALLLWLGGLALLILAIPVVAQVKALFGIAVG